MGMEGEEGKARTYVLNERNMRATMVDVVARLGLLTINVSRMWLSALLKARAGRRKKRKRQTTQKIKQIVAVEAVCITRTPLFEADILSQCVFQVFLGFFCEFFVKGIEMLIMARHTLSSYDHNPSYLLTGEKDEKKDASKYPK